MSSEQQPHMSESDLYQNALKSVVGAVAGRPHFHGALVAVQALGGRMLALAEENAELRGRLAELQAPPPGNYTCGCPAQWAERRLKLFCDTHYRPFSSGTDWSNL